MTTLAYSSPPAAGESFLWRFRREVSVVLAYGALLAVLGVFRPEFFRSQFRSTWVSAAPTLIAAVGMTLVIISRQIDISIGSQFSVCGMLAGSLAAAGLPVWAAALGAIVGGGVMGAVNGAMVAGLRLPSIVVTLATMVILRGLLLWQTSGAAVHLPEGFQWFGRSQQAGQTIIVITALLVLLIFACGMRWLAGGRSVYAVGSDEEAARLSGIRPKRVIFWTFVITGALTGLAALLESAKFALVYPNAGDGFELKVIAAVVVGGTAISGGRGTLIGTLIGVALLGIIGPTRAFLSDHSQWDKAIAGAIILIATSGDVMYRRAR